MTSQQVESRMRQVQLQLLAWMCGAPPAASLAPNMVHTEPPLGWRTSFLVQDVSMAMVLASEKHKLEHDALRQFLPQVRALAEEALRRISASSTALASPQRMSSVTARTVGGSPAV